jgi:Gti1/Pac2 family transcription factor
MSYPQTFSLTIGGTSQHLISYYRIEDVEQGRLRSPSSLPELSCLDINPEYLDKTHFRNPPKVEIGIDGLPRYRGEADEVDSSDAPGFYSPVSPAGQPLAPPEHGASSKRGKRYDPYTSSSPTKRPRKSKALTKHHEHPRPPAPLSDPHQSTTIQMTISKPVVPTAQSSPPLYTEPTMNAQPTISAHPQYPSYAIAGYYPAYPMAPLLPPPSTAPAPAVYSASTHSPSTPPQMPPAHPLAYPGHSPPPPPASAASAASSGSGSGSSSNMADSQPHAHSHHHHQYHSQQHQQQQQQQAYSYYYPPTLPHPHVHYAPPYPSWSHYGATGGGLYTQVPHLHQQQPQPPHAHPQQATAPPTPAVMPAVAAGTLMITGSEAVKGTASGNMDDEG